MIPTIRQLALSLYASSRAVERLPREKSYFPTAYLPRTVRASHDVFPLATMALSDDGHDTESVFAELN